MVRSSFCKETENEEISSTQLHRYDIDSLFLVQVLDRGERIELLVDKTENLQFQVHHINPTVT